MSNSKRIQAVILHGTLGYPEENWFPWLAQQLECIGVSTRVPRLPTPAGQCLESWRSAFALQIGSLDENTILIGHSLGAVFALRQLEQSHFPVLGTSLVSGFTEKLRNPKFDDLNSSFLSEPFRWDEIRSNAGAVFIYASDDDPYVPLEQNVALAKILNAELIVIRGAGHFNTASGYSSFESLFDKIKNLIEHDRKRM